MIENLYNGNILDFFEIINKLSKIEAEILQLCFNEGRLTRKQIIDKLKIDKNILDNILNKLVENRIIYKYKIHNIEFFELNLSLLRLLRIEKFPSGPIIPLVYQFNLISDEKRTKVIKKAIEKLIKPNDLVIDIGCGTGILSVFAARKGASVIAIEADPLVADAAEFFIRNLGLSSKIKIIRGDSRELNLPEKVDVIICEMFDTALIAELQVPVMNDAVKKWLKKDGIVIPKRAETSAELVYTDYNFYDIDFKLIHFEAYGSRESSDVLSNNYIYHVVDFSEENYINLSKKFNWR